MKAFPRLVVFLCSFVLYAHASKIVPDGRCRFPSTLNLNDATAVDKNNQECSIEWEVLRYTVARRMGIAATAMQAPENKLRLEEEMKRLWDPRFSYVIRQRSREMVSMGDPHYNWYGTSSLFDSLFSKEVNYHVAVSAENAWPTNFQGKTVQEIAYNLAEQPGNGWNYHPGHAENVFTACDTIGVGVTISEGGYVTAYTQFASRVK